MIVGKQMIEPISLLIGSGSVIAFLVLKKIFTKDKVWKICSFDPKDENYLKANDVSKKLEEKRSNEIKV